MGAPRERRDPGVKPLIEVFSDSHIMPLRLDAADLCRVQVGDDDSLADELWASELCESSLTGGRPSGPTTSPSAAACLSLGTRSQATTTWSDTPSSFLNSSGCQISAGAGNTPAGASGALSLHGWGVASASSCGWRASPPLQQQPAGRDRGAGTAARLCAPPRHRGGCPTGSASPPCLAHWSSSCRCSSMARGPGNERLQHQAEPAQQLQHVVKDGAGAARSVLTRVNGASCSRYVLPSRTSANSASSARCGLQLRHRLFDLVRRATAQQLMQPLAARLLIRRIHWPRFALAELLDHGQTAVRSRLPKVVGQLAVVAGEQRVTREVAVFAERNLHARRSSATRSPPTSAGQGARINDVAERLDIFAIDRPPAVGDDLRGSGGPPTSSSPASTAWKRDDLLAHQGEWPAALRLPQNARVRSLSLQRRVVVAERVDPRR